MTNKNEGNMGVPQQMKFKEEWSINHIIDQFRDLDPGEQYRHFKKSIENLGLSLEDLMKPNYSQAELILDMLNNFHEQKYDRKEYDEVPGGIKNELGISIHHHIEKLKIERNDS